MILITRTPKKVIGLEGYNIKITKQELIWWKKVDVIGVERNNKKKNLNSSNDREDLSYSRIHISNEQGLLDEVQWMEEEGRKDLSK